MVLDTLVRIQAEVYKVDEERRAAEAEQDQQLVEQ